MISPYSASSITPRSSKSRDQRESDEDGRDPHIRFEGPILEYIGNLDPFLERQLRDGFVQVCQSLFDE